MADEADMTAERMEREDELRRKYRAETETKHYDSCRWCGDPTENGAGFCGKDCHTDWHKYEATLKRLNLRR